MSSIQQGLQKMQEKKLQSAIQRQFKKLLQTAPPEIQNLMTFCWKYNEEALDILDHFGNTFGFEHRVKQLKILSEDISMYENELKNINNSKELNISEDNMCGEPSPEERFDRGQNLNNDSNANENKFDDEDEYFASAVDSDEEITHKE